MMTETTNGRKGIPATAEREGPAGRERDEMPELLEILLEGHESGCKTGHVLERMYWILRRIEPALNAVAEAVGGGTGDAKTLAGRLERIAAQVRMVAHGLYMEGDNLRERTGSLCSHLHYRSVL